MMVNLDIGDIKMYLSDLDIFIEYIKDAKEQLEKHYINQEEIAVEAAKARGQGPVNYDFEEPNAPTKENKDWLDDLYNNDGYKEGNVFREDENYT